MRAHFAIDVRDALVPRHLAVPPPRDPIWKILKSITIRETEICDSVEKSAHAPLVSKIAAPSGMVASPTVEELSAIFDRPLIQQSQRALWLTSTAAARTISCH
jgi:hypothetical protein